jgi:cell wall-associated NlpC family hydrolase
MATVTTHAAAKTIIHKIKSGESLYTIAKKNHTTIETLCKINHIQKNRVLKAGHIIKIPVTKVSSKSIHRRQIAKQNYRKTYVVKKGDTLSSLARKHHTTVSTLRKVNGLKRGDILKLGQKLSVPGYTEGRKHIYVAKKSSKKQEKKLAKTLIRLESEKVATVKTDRSKHFSLSDIVFGGSDKLSPKSKRIIELAKKKLGKRYVWGAVGQRNTFDCSGLTTYVCKANGIRIPRRAIEQSKYGKYVPRDKLQPGDLVFFDTSKRRKGYVNHVGIYIGNGKFIHASSAKKKVVITSLDKPFYSQRFKGARRVASL